MRIQSFNQNNLSNCKKQQNFTAFTVSGQKVDVIDLCIENSLSRRIIKDLIDKVVGINASRELRDGIGNSIQGLVEHDEFLSSNAKTNVSRCETTTNVSRCGTSYMLRMKKIAGEKEATYVINLDPEDIAEKAKNISPIILQDLRRADDWGCNGSERYLAQPVKSPIEWEIGNRFTDANNTLDLQLASPEERIKILNSFPKDSPFHAQFAPGS